MSLRSRLVLLLGGLVAVLLAAEWSLVRALTRDLDEEVDGLALSVGSSLVSLFAPADAVVELPAPAAPSGEARAAGRDLPAMHRLALHPAPWRPDGEMEVVFFTSPAGADGPAELGMGQWRAEPPRAQWKVERHVARELPLTVADDGSSLPRRDASDRAAAVHVEGPSAAGGDVTARVVELRIGGRVTRLRSTESWVAFDGGAGLFAIRGGGSPAAGAIAARAHAAGPRDVDGQIVGLREVDARADGAHILDSHTVDSRSVAMHSAESHAVDSRSVAMHSAESHAVDAHAADASAGETHAGEKHAFDSHPAGARAPAAGDSSVAVAPPPTPFAPADAEGAAESARIPVPRAGLARATDAFRSKLLLGSIALFVLGLGVVAWVAHRVTRPLRGLARAAARVGDGELGVQVPLDGDREVAATLAAFNGMSARLAALDDEARRLREREHLAELGDVARGLAHALRNPLHTLGLAVDALARGEADSAAVASAARTQIQRVDRALRSFLTLAGGGGASAQIAVDDVARDVALELAQSTRPTRVTVEAPDGPVRLRAVAAELRAVIHALVVNSSEAAPDGEVIARITAERDRSGAELVRVEVLDRGPGIPPELRDRLFTPHVSSKPQGAGMGLYLALRIVRARYAGDLRLEDREGGGTRAVLELRGAAARGAGEEGAAER